MNRPSRNRRRESWGAVALCLPLLLGAPALADDDEDGEADYTRPGLYLGLNGLSAIANFNRPFELHPTGGLNGRIGWRGDEYIAQEIEFAWKNGFEAGGADAEVRPGQWRRTWSRAEPAAISHKQSSGREKIPLARRDLTN